MRIYWLQMLQLAIPAAVVFACFYPYRKRALDAQHLRSGFLREAGLILLVMSVFGILSVTLRPFYTIEESEGMWGDLVLHIGRPHHHYNVNLRPFRMFTLYYNTFRNGDYFFTLVNLAGNLLVFVPLGLLPSLLFRNSNWFRAVWIGGGLSLLIEFGQYFLGRATDVDDVILNTLGSLSGYWLFLLLRRISPSFVQRFRCQKK